MLADTVNTYYSFDILQSVHLLLSAIHRAYLIFKPHVKFTHLMQLNHL